MKSIFKKNQIIITALAIMIAVAGYLNFTKDNIDNSKMANINEGNLAITDDNDIYADISDEDLEEASAGLNVSDDNSLVVEENKAAETAKAGEKDETASAETSANSDNVEDKVSSPGEAILASTTLDSGYFSTARLQREQNRAKNKEIFWNLVTDPTTSEDDKKVAMDKLFEIADVSDKENAAEILLEAKGFDGVVVSIIDGKVDVVVNSESITDAQVAQIEDIVTRKTGAEIKDIVITSVIVEE